MITVVGEQSACVIASHMVIMIRRAAKIWFAGINCETRDIGIAYRDCLNKAQTKLN